MLIERVEQRVLGALQLVDRVTRTPVRRPMRIHSDTAQSIRNRRGLYVITHADGLESHIQAFREPPATPAIGANEYSFEISDPQGRFLPRLLSLRLPRNAGLENLGNDDSLFRPRDVAMYPAQTAPLSHNWSTIRASVSGPAHSSVRGALIRIIDPEDDAVLASGISDEWGEVLVVIPGVPVTKFASEDDGDHEDGEAPVVVNVLPVRLEVSLGASTPWPVNPDLLERNHAADRRVSMDLTLSTGRMERIVITLT